MNRRTAIKWGLLSGTLWLSGLRSAGATLECFPGAPCTACDYKEFPDSPPPQSWPRSPHIPRFEQPLRLLETLQPLKSQPKDVTKDTPSTDYFQIEMHKLNVQILPEGPTTELWVYLGARPDGSLCPWPVIRQKGGILPEGVIVPPDEEQRQSVVRFVNRLGKDRDGNPICTSVHLHGMASAPEYNGYAEDLIQPDYFKNYVYPNDRAATIWYHDHAISKTSRNVAMGLAGFYLVEDQNERESGLPMGEYDIPLLLQEVTLEGPTLPGDRPNPNHGQAIFNNRLERSHYGDIPLINGVPWPRLTVERRRYRFPPVECDCFAALPIIY
ncbi:MAG: multicopper oxidase domain-containing protein [Cyanobacteria bacterium P01_E01_bin.34]